MLEPITIYAIEIKNGYLVSLKPWNFHSRDAVFSYLFDNEYPKDSWHNRWGVISNLPKSVTKKLPTQYENYRYELIDPTMENEKIPFIISKDDATYQNDGCTYWHEEYKHLQSLYELKKDELPEKFEEVEFEISVLIKSPETIEPDKFEYFIPGQWSSPKNLKGNILYGKTVSKDLVGTILTPEVLHHELPCRMSSKQVFDVIRGHIQKNYDRERMELTSDYEFHLCVNKIIDTEPINMSKEILKKNGGSYKTPRYKRWTVKQRKIPVLDIAPAKEKGRWGKNCVITPSIEASSEKELKEKIDKLLDRIMAVLNDPIEDCHHCNGSGVQKIDAHKVNVNENS